MNYSENKFRRFTFFLETNSKENIEPFFNANVVKLQGFEILNIEGYSKENLYFFIVEASAKMNFSAMKKAFEIPTILSEPLERIYEFEQKEVYTKQDGQLKTSLGKYKRFVWTLLLEEAPELMAEYKKAHSIGQAWPQITKNMKQVGVLDMEIYLHGHQAILIMDTKPTFDLEKDGAVWQNLPRENEWQEYVSKFQRTNSESSIQEKWLDMAKIDF